MVSIAYLSSAQAGVSLRTMHKTLVRLSLSGGIGAAIGLAVAISMDRGNLSVAALWHHGRILDWLVIALIFSALGVVVFWALPALMAWLLKRLLG